MIDKRRTLSSLVVLALLAGLLTVSSSQAASGAPQKRGDCSTQTQGISDRVGVSCKKAKRVRAKASRALGGLPECTSQPNQTYRGWEISGGSKPGEIITTVFIKGDKSFIVSGGGAC